MPFLDENDNDYYTDGQDDFYQEKKKSTFGGDRRFYLIGGGASLFVFFSIIAFIYHSNKPIDLGELPVIQAEETPIKVKPTNNKQVEHQDKFVYDNISGETREIKAHIAPKPEEPSLDDFPYQRKYNDVLSQEEKESIIREFDELAPRTSPAHIEPKPRVAKQRIESETQSPINKIEVKQEKKKKKVAGNIVQKLKKSGLIELDNFESRGTIMIQIASVSSKAKAEAEYKRISRKNKILRNIGKKIIKVDLGAKKGIKYRLQVGPFKNKKEASKVISALKDNGVFSYISK